MVYQQVSVQQRLVSKEVCEQQFLAGERCHKIQVQVEKAIHNVAVPVQHCLPANDVFCTGLPLHAWSGKL